MSTTDPTDLEALSRQRIAMRYWLLGAGYHDAAEALTWAEWFHSGTRKDGVTPEFSHQIAIASHIRTLIPHLRHPQEAITTVFCHDVREDYDVDDDVIRSKYGDLVADAVWALTKTFRGEDRDLGDVFAQIGTNPIASIVKPADRIHNQHTMVGVFSAEKIVAYTDETRQWFLPMIKTARRRFVDQEPAYEAVSLVLHTQLRLLDAFVEALEHTPVEA